MKDLIFQFGSEMIAVRIMDNRDIYFCKLQGGWFKGATIDGLKLSLSGILKEFPDLKDKPESEIRLIAIQRFKDKCKSLSTEIEVADYITNDLKQHGYILKFIRRKGFRDEKVG